MGSFPFYHRHLLSVIWQLSGVYVKRLVIGRELRVSKQRIILLTNLDDLSDFLLDGVFIFFILLFIFILIHHLARAVVKFILIILSPTSWRLHHLLVIIERLRSLNFYCLSKLTSLILLIILFLVHLLLGRVHSAIVVFLLVSFFAFRLDARFFLGGAPLQLLLLLFLQDLLLLFHLS
mmetsp:Transcript_24254/g.23857  ORF Transcript_24254/g.23857 Transcript_24254/m.23857 type:complete len:178 (+) Transcript_24254:2412-2945(+)